MFYPVPYELFVLCMRTYEIFLDSNINNPCFQLYYGIINNGLAALSLLEGNFLENAYPLCRGIIKMYFKLLILKDNAIAAGIYEKFTRFELDQSCCSQEYPEEFCVLFEKRTNQKQRNKVDYLHYGWLDCVEEYHENVKQFPYSMRGIITFLESYTGKKQKLELNQLESLYKVCNGYTHGSVQRAKYPELHYFEISIMLYYTILNTFVLFCKEENVETTISGVNVIEMLNKDFEELYEQYKNCSTENFEAQQKKDYL